MESQQDYQRLIQLCNSYGLNQEQTRQIITQFKSGFLTFDQNSSMNSQQHYQNESIKFDQQISFKHKNMINSNKHLVEKAPFDKMTQLNHEVAQHQRTFSQENNNDLILNSLNQLKSLYQDVKKTNENLTQSCKQKDSQIQTFIELKKQDSQTICQLKNSIVQLTSLLKQKQNNFMELQSKYNNILEEKVMTQKIEKKFKQNNNTQNISKSQVQQQVFVESTNNLPPYNQNYSQKSLQRNTSSTIIKEQLDEQNNRVRKRIDVGKYRGMIQQLRNSYNQNK